MYSAVTLSGSEAKLLNYKQQFYSKNLFVETLYLFSGPVLGFCDRILKLWYFLIVSMCLVTVLKVYSSQLITCYLDQISTVTHSRLCFKAGENNHSESSIGMRRRPQKKKKKNGFWNLSPTCPSHIAF